MFGARTTPVLFSMNRLLGDSVYKSRSLSVCLSAPGNPCSQQTGDFWSKSVPLKLKNRKKGFFPEGLDSLLRFDYLLSLSLSHLFFGGGLCKPACACTYWARQQGLGPSITWFYKWFHSKIVVALLSSDRGVFCDEIIRSKFSIIKCRGGTLSAWFTAWGGDEIDTDGHCYYQTEAAQGPIPCKIQVCSSKLQKN